MKRFGTVIKNLALKVWLRIVDNTTYIDYLRKHGVTVGKNVNFRYPEHTTIDLTRPSLVEFGDNIDINDYFTILTHDFGTFVLRNKFLDFVNSSGRVKIGNNVVFGRNVTILKGVEIGDNTIVALGAVITKNTPPNSVVAGAPARVVCSLEDYYKKRKEKSVEEALEYAASVLDRKGRMPRITELSEEWVHFLTKEEYENIPEVRHQVDFRLTGYIDKDEFLSRKKLYNGYEDLLKAVKDYYNQHSK